MISEAAKAAFRRRASLPSNFDGFSPTYVAKLRSFAAAIGGSDPFVEPNSPALNKPPAVTQAALTVAPTALDIEFERVRAAANARLAAEREARLAEDQAVASILATLPAQL